MVDRDRIKEKVREMQAMIRVGQERIARHSPVWAVYLASETLRSLGESLDEIEKEITEEELQPASPGSPSAIRRAG